MRTKKKVSTFLLTFLLCSGLIAGCKTNTQRTLEASNAINISADDLYKAYQSSESDADRLYQGKVLIVTGTAGTTDLLARNPSVELTSGASRAIVQCFGFSPDQKDAISKLASGQKVSVRGKCMGKAVMPIPVLEDCVLQ